MATARMTGIATLLLPPRDTADPASVHTWSDSASFTTSDVRNSVGGTVTIHTLKCAAGHFEAVEMGLKTAELRIADRDYKTLDFLELQEMGSNGPTGRVCWRLITHIVWDSNGPWLAKGYCMLSLQPAHPQR
jgi:hypothetical protein